MIAKDLAESSSCHEEPPPDESVKNASSELFGKTLRFLERTEKM
jgi:hypothetical protein